jgi:hypothetical protein
VILKPKPEPEPKPKPGLAHAAAARYQQRQSALTRPVPSAHCPLPTAHCPLPTLAPWSCSCSPAHFTTGSSSHRPSPSAAAHIKHKSHCLAQTHSRCPSAILQSDSATVALRRVSPSILHILHSFVQHCTEHFIRSCKWYSDLSPNPAPVTGSPPTLCNLEARQRLIGVKKSTRSITTSLTSSKFPPTWSFRRRSSFPAKLRHV